MFFSWDSTLFLWKPWEHSGSPHCTYLTSVFALWNNFRELYKCIVILTGGPSLVWLLANFISINPVHLIITLNLSVILSEFGAFSGGGGETTIIEKVILCIIHFWFIFLIHLPPSEHLHHQVIGWYWNWIWRTTQRLEIKWFGPLNHNHHYKCTQCQWCCRGIWNCWGLYWVGRGVWRC